VQDPATDLAVASAILSSVFDHPIDPNTCLAAEISLTGELKTIMRIDQRIEEASRLGFNRIIIPENAKLKQRTKSHQNIQVLSFSKIEQAVRLLFSKN